VKALAAVAGLLLLAVVLWDAFETIILPRRVTRRFRLTRLFYRATWRPFAAASRLVPSKRHETYLSFYGPLSLVGLLVLWAAALVAAFGFLQYAEATPVQLSDGSRSDSLATNVYLSGTTLFTLGLGDVVPRGRLARALAVVEAGTGFGFLAVVIGYFPVIYQAFSRREVNISLLDARAGSPPTAAELLRRHRGTGGIEALERLLHEWEQWAAELLESHLSYPVLAYFRSQHKNESWLTALTTVLDASALLMVGVTGGCARQARLTFAMARHALVDLAQVFGTPPAASPERLSPAALAALRGDLAAAGFPVAEGGALDARLAELRAMYEPYAAALSRYLLQPLPSWRAERPRPDNWQTSAWAKAPEPSVEEEHF
jgi:hypothetical protein